MRSWDQKQPRRFVEGRQPASFHDPASELHDPAKASFRTAAAASPTSYRSCFEASPAGAGTNARFMAETNPYNNASYLVYHGAGSDVSPMHGPGSYDSVAKQSIDSTVRVHDPSRPSAVFHRAQHRPGKKERGRIVYPTPPEDGRAPNAALLRDRDPASVSAATSGSSGGTLGGKDNSHAADFSTQRRTEPRLLPAREQSPDSLLYHGAGSPCGAEVGPGQFHPHRRCGFGTGAAAGAGSGYGQRLSPAFASSDGHGGMDTVLALGASRRTNSPRFFAQSESARHTPHSPVSILGGTLGVGVEASARVTAGNTTMATAASSGGDSESEEGDDTEVVAVGRQQRRQQEPLQQQQQQQQQQQLRRRRGPQAVEPTLVYAGRISHNLTHTEDFARGRLNDAPFSSFADAAAVPPGKRGSTRSASAHRPLTADACNNIVSVSFCRGGNTPSPSRGGMGIRDRSIEHRSIARTGSPVGGGVGTGVSLRRSLSPTCLPPPSPRPLSPPARFVEAQVRSTSPDALRYRAQTPDGAMSPRHPGRLEEPSPATGGMLPEARGLPSAAPHGLARHTPGGGAPLPVAAAGGLSSTGATTGGGGGGGGGARFSARGVGASAHGMRPSPVFLSPGSRTGGGPQGSIARVPQPLRAFLDVTPCHDRTESAVFRAHLHVRATPSVRGQCPEAAASSCSLRDRRVAEAAAAAAADTLWSAKKERARRRAARREKQVGPGEDEVARPPFAGASMAARHGAFCTGSYMRGAERVMMDTRGCLETGPDMYGEW